MKFLGSIAVASVLAAVASCVPNTGEETMEDLMGEERVVLDSTKQSEEPPSFVTRLTSQNFQNTIENNPVALVKFHTSWCGHCKNLAPIYREAAHVLHVKHNHSIYDVDCENDGLLCDQLGIRGYPTVRLWYKGQVMEDFYDRSVDGIVNYIENMYVDPIVRPSTREAFQSLFETRQTALFIHVDSGKNSELTSLFSQFADMNRSFGKFLSVPIDAASDVLAALNILDFEPGVYCLRVFDDHTSKLPEAAVTLESLREFVIFERYPVMMEVGKEAADIADLLHTPIVLIFYDSDQVREQIRVELESFAKESRRSFIFTFSKGFDVAQNIGFTTEKYPCLAVYDLDQNKPFLMDQGKDITLQNVKHFLNNLESEAVTPEVPTPSEETPPAAPPKKEAEFSIWTYLSCAFLSFSPLLL